MTTMTRWTTRCRTGEWGMIWRRHYSSCYKLCDHWTGVWAWQRARGQEMEAPVMQNTILLKKEERNSEEERHILNWLIILIGITWRLKFKSWCHLIPLMRRFLSGLCHMGQHGSLGDWFFSLTQQIFTEPRLRSHVMTLRRVCQLSCRTIAGLRSNKFQIFKNQKIIMCKKRRSEKMFFYVNIILIWSVNTEWAVWTF